MSNGVVTDTPGFPLLSAMQAYVQKKRKRFHVPGHAGRPFWREACALQAQQLGLSDALLQMDLTELEGLDALSTPEGVLRESQALLAARYGAEQSFYLMNGSSCGLHAAIMASVEPGDTLLVPRNAHRSVMAAMVLADVQPQWFLPEWESEWGIWGAVGLEALEVAWRRAPHAKGLVLTSPTYEGILSPVEAIAAWCTEKGLRLIVDEAHGAHLPFMPGCPPSACSTLGVDAVVQSPHKTLGALTQGAWLHLPPHSRLNASRVQATLNTLQTTSPSYLILASLELAAGWCASEIGQAQRQVLMRNVLAVRKRLAGMTAFRLLCHVQSEGAKVDPLRFTLRHAYQCGEDWTDEIEQQYGLSYECHSTGVGVFIAQPGHEPADFVRLIEALQAYALDYPNHLAPGGAMFEPFASPQLPWPQVVASPRAAFFSQKTTLPAAAAVGQVAAETLVRCPPGIPVLLAGERIQQSHVPYLDATVTVLG
jgi:arginine decarboxylase